MCLNTFLELLSEMLHSLAVRDAGERLSTSGTIGQDEACISIWRGLMDNTCLAGLSGPQESKSQDSSVCVISIWCGLTDDRAKPVQNPNAPRANLLLSLRSLRVTMIEPARAQAFSCRQREKQMVRLGRVRYS